MAITLAVNIVSGTDNPIVLSGAPASPAIQIDNEILAIDGPIPPSFQVVPWDGPSGGRDPGTPTSGGGRRVDLTNVSVRVQRGFLGTQPAVHTAGATVTELWPAYAAQRGAVVTVP